MRVLVTGCAGFIGSHLVERLVALGNEVIGVDCFTENYPRRIKEANLRNSLEKENFHLLEIDLVTADLAALPEVDAVLHLAAQPGVRSSWGDPFSLYLERNVLATQRLLERFKRRKDIKFIIASSSSVYGNAKRLPIREDEPLKPISPYGVTKQAMESIVYTYHINHDLNTTLLRYFTVYGPRQRPDMAFYKFIDYAIRGEEVVIFGDGNQTRDFTYVSDAIEGTILALENCYGFNVFNIAGGSRTSILNALETIELILGVKVQKRFSSAQLGDVKDTYADIKRAKDAIGYEPKVSLKDGLRKQIEWQKMEKYEKD